MVQVAIDWKVWFQRQNSDVKLNNPSDKGGGMKYIDPERPSGNHVRVMEDYVKVIKDGQFVDRGGCENAE